MVPNGALRFRPTAEMLATSDTGAASGSGTATGARNGATEPDSARRAQRALGGMAATGADSARRAARRASMSMLYMVDSTGKLRAIPVVTGLSDGQYTVVRGPQISEGMSIVVGATTSGTAAASTNASPFQSSTPTPRGPGGPPGF